MPRDLEPASVRATGARLLTELTALASGFEATPGSIAERLCRAFGAPTRRARRAIEAALILCADHELNASAFAARVIAATGATPYMPLIGALGALSGRRHGGMTEAVTRLLESPGSVADVLAGPLRRGEAIAGFGHPLYPDGDPRATRLLELCPKHGERRRALEFASAVESARGLRPNVDFGLVALCRA